LNFRCACRVITSQIRRDLKDCVARPGAQIGDRQVSVQRWVSIDCPRDEQELSDPRQRLTIVAKLMGAKRRCMQEIG
jgi:hypothetical protein